MNRPHQHFRPIDGIPMVSLGNSQNTSGRIHCYIMICYLHGCKMIPPCGANQTYMGLSCTHFLSLRRTLLCPYKKRAEESKKKEEWPTIRGHLIITYVEVSNYGGVIH